MIPVPYYKIAYYIVISCIALILCANLFVSNSAYLKDGPINKVWSVVLLLVTILFIGLRDPWGAFEYFGDTNAYTTVYYDINLKSIQYVLEQKDIGFYLFMKLCASVMNVSMFYLLCAFLYVYPVYVTLKKWFGDIAIYALLMYVVSMSFLAFGINGIRNGLAVSFFIFATGNINRKWLMILFILVAISIHKSVLLPALLFFVSFFIKRTKWTVTVWFISIAVCLLAGAKMKNFTQIYLAGIIDDTRLTSSQTPIEWAGQKVLDNIRFRLDFILYSAVPIFLGWFYVVKKKFNDKFYIQLLNTYILTNAVWIGIFMYAAYTNRYAFLSWCIMPIVMVYPLLKGNLMKNQYRFIGYLAFGSLIFTLVMVIK